MFQVCDYDGNVSGQTRMIHSVFHILKTIVDKQLIF